MLDGFLRKWALQNLYDLIFHGPLLGLLPASDTRRARQARAVVPLHPRAELLRWGRSDEVLRQIAAVTGGEFRVGTLGTPSIRPARQVRVGSLRTVAIWSHPSLLFLALALLAGSTSGDPGEGVMG